VENWPFRQNFLPQLMLISDAFEIRNLIKHVKYGLLPHDYDSSEESYVMYLQDAQNLFNKKMQNTEIGKLTKTGMCPNTRVKLSSLPWACRRRSFERIQCRENGIRKGQVKKYIRFVTETLKPFVDSNFRTKGKAIYGNRR
jgi:predicted alpha/beta superfamily hydrolase